MSGNTQDPPNKTTCEPSQEKLSPAQEEVRNIIYTMHQDPTLQGISMICRDGVLRSLDADRNVMDAVPLRPELIRAYLELMPPSGSSVDNVSAFQCVDGRHVPREQYFSPPEGLLPRPLPELLRERDPAKSDEYRKIYHERRAQLTREGRIEHDSIRSA